jgi:hypothetical protein
MRTIRRAITMAVVGATVLTQLAAATAARADGGGSYISFNRTYYLPGDDAIGRAYASIPKNQRDILDRGPFWVYVLPEGVRSLKPGNPVPSAAIRVGMFTVRAEHNFFSLRARFPVPQLPADTYWVGACNDPCTVAGFTQPLSGSFQVVATAREVMLLKENGSLRSKVFGLQHQLRKATEDADVTHGQLATAQRERDVMIGAVKDLQRQLAVAEVRAASAEARRPVVPWMVAGAAIALLLIVCAVLFAHRARRRMGTERSSEVPDAAFDDDLGCERLGHAPNVLEDRLGDVLGGEPGDAAFGEPSVDAKVDRVQTSPSSSALEDDLGDHASPVGVLDESVLEERGDVGIRQ